MPSGPLESCTICTTDANDMMGKLHDRMPIILPVPAIEMWLDQSVTDVERLKGLLQQYHSDLMQSWQVGKDVGNVKNQGPQLMAPVAPPEALELKPTE